MPPSFGADPFAVQERFRDQWVLISGHFDDSAAETCVATGIEGETPSPAEAIEICRSTFVLSAIGPAPAVTPPPTAALAEDEPADPLAWPFPTLLLLTAAGLLVAARGRHRSGWHE